MIGWGNDFYGQLGVTTPPPGTSYTQIATGNHFTVGLAEPVYTTHCTVAPTSIPGCVPGINATGVPSASATSGFVLDSGPIPGGNIGIFFFGHEGPAAPVATPFGDLCIDGSTGFFRGTLLVGGGTFGTCSGRLTMDWNTYAQGVPVYDPLATVPGTPVDGQFWYRDPANPNGANLTDAIRFVVGD